MAVVPICFYAAGAVFLLFPAVGAFSSLPQPSSPSLAPIGGPARAPLIGARYFGGWYNCSLHPTPSCWSHFKGFSPLGAPTEDFFPYYPSRTPTLGLYSTALDTIVQEVHAADRAMDYFAVLYYDADADCGPNPDPNLSYCLDTSLAFMLNSSAVWEGIQRMHFFVTYSNDVDRGRPGQFVGPAGHAAWQSRVGTWVAAMAHPHYLRIAGRPLFEVLIPDIFLTDQCGGNATLAGALLEELREAGVASGVGKVLIGGGWQNPSIPSTPPPAPRPHPLGYMLYSATTIPCSPSCDLQTLTVNASFLGCSAACNATPGCTAFVHFAAAAPAPAAPSAPSAASAGAENCTLKSSAGPGAGAGPGVDTYVRVVESPNLYEWTATYNAAPPLCPGEVNEVCPQYRNSWWPNATAEGAQVFPYTQCSTFQAQARGNHSADPVPYLPNLIAGFDPRPWEEHAPSFYPPTEAEWEAALVQVRELVMQGNNTKFGFPDDTSPSGVQPAVCIYAWNEWGEGGVLAPSLGQGSMMLDTVGKLFAPPSSA
jgi:hypothetical protein